MPSANDAFPSLHVSALQRAALIAGGAPALFD
jgi:hypothetical protein